MTITSASNPRIKTLAELKERKAREREGRFLIEGAREIARAAAAGIELEQLFAAETLDSEETTVLESLTRLLPATRLTEGPLKKLSSRENPAGLIAVARIPTRSLAGFTPPKNALILLLVGLEKPGNLGAILRSADAAGTDAVLLTGGVDLFNPQVIRNSTGVIFSLPTFAAPQSEVSSWLKQHNIPLLATTPHTPHTYWDSDLRGAVAIVLGTEHEGLSEDWLEAATHKVKIPMQGQADSLNVSVTAALMLFEACRQRRQD